MQHITHNLGVLFFPSLAALNPSNTILKYKPGHHQPLDGVRGIAVLLVLLFHVYGMPPLETLTQFGRDGVDVFFVLSGFLITGLLLDAKGDSHYFRFFYARRALRILPLYLLLVIGYLVLRGTQDYNPWTWLTFTFNIDMAIHGSNKMVIMNHLWSISQEEQFYIIWPLLLLWLNARALKWLLGILTLLAPILRATAYSHDFAYLFPLSRMDSIALGCLTMILLREGRITNRLLRLGFAVALAGTAIMVAWQLLEPHNWRVFETGMHSALCLLTACVIAGSYHHAAYNRGLTIKPLQWLGKYSYGIYMIHMPVLYILQTVLHYNTVGLALQYSIATAAIPVSLLLAYATYHLYEKRFLRLKRRFRE